VTGTTDVQAPPGRDGLTRATLGGIWAGLPTPFDAHGRLDADALARSVEIAGGWGIAGVYTTGSTGEWYAVDDLEFGDLIDAVVAGRAAAEQQGRQLPVQAGITGTSTGGVLRRAAMAVDRGADAFQVALPPWIALTDDEVVRFLEALASAHPGVPIVHYNVARAGRLLDGPLYRRVADAVPELIGAKITGADDELWSGLRAHAPDLGFLVGETLLPRRMADGARGTCSSYIYYAPAVMLELFAASATGGGETAATERLLRRLHAFEAEAIDPLAERGFVDAAIDKAFAEAAGWLPMSRVVREPYSSVPAEEVRALAALIERSYPEFREVPR
jgi:dihydrodipicolinate synthase/N-acetylneuraminate lyase